jgi:hypothetical protein
MTIAKTHIVATRSLIGTALILLAGLVYCRAVPDKSLDGYWLSDGYGTLAEIKGDHMRLYEVTSISCIESDALVRQTGPTDSRGDRFLADKDSDPIFVTPGPTNDSRWFHVADAASSMLFNRTQLPPKPCESKTPNDPETNFEVFWRTFAAHHGFLKYRGVDWQAAYQTYRPRVNGTTKPEDLFDILSAMIEPLHDAHTYIRAEDIKRSFHGKRPGTLMLTDEEKRKTVEIIQKKYLEEPLRSWCNGHVRYARLKQNAGYLRIDTFWGYAPGDHFDDGARALDEALDEAMKDAQQLEGLVIDVRRNGGGSDPYGVQVAGRLTDKPYVAFVKRARDDADDPARWTAPQPSTVRVSDRPRFLKQVVELIGPDTVSAGETFTMALMGRQPHIMRVGENTQGVYSDVLSRHLPNGWRFGMPNEVFLTEDGKHFEATGVPPEVRVPVFPREDFEQERDSALEKALELLSKN